MRHGIAGTVTALLLVLCGCKTVHTREDALPVAIWASTVLIDLKGQPPPAETHEIVTRVLADHGLHPVVNEGGVPVPEAEETCAREAMLTDKRLAGSGVEVLLIIPAGTGRTTRAGFEVPVVAPSEPIRLPATTGPTTSPGD